MTANTKLRNILQKQHDEMGKLLDQRASDTDLRRLALNQIFELLDHHNKDPNGLPGELIDGIVKAWNPAWLKVRGRPRRKAS